MRNRRGGTLIELLVALLLLDLAIVSLATVGAVTVKRVGDASRRSRAAIAAANRVERLTLLPCSAASSGAAPIDSRVTEVWTVSRTGPTLEITELIELPMRPRERVLVRRRIPC